MRRKDEASRPAVCPRAEELAAYNLGRLSHDRLEAVATHLVECKRCEDVLRELPDEDSLLANLRCCREADADTTIDEPECRELGARAEAIPVQDATAPDGHWPAVAAAL